MFFVCEVCEVFLCVFCATRNSRTDGVKLEIIDNGIFFLEWSSPVPARPRGKDLSN